MAYELPKLPYDYNALEPHIDARTMEIHHRSIIRLISPTLTTRSKAKPISKTNRLKI